MRLFDCKRRPCRTVTTDAPRLLDHLCDACSEHFDRVRRTLDDRKITYRVEPRLIRGQDYYNRTTFEFEATSLESAQLALGGGGRYDGFVEALGGPSTPGIGFGLGIERILLAASAEHLSFVTEAATTPRVDVFVLDTTGGAQATEITERLRRSSVRTDRAYDRRSYKAQLKAALRSKAPLALVIEPDGWTIRTLQAKGEPTVTDAATAVDDLRKRLQDPTS